MKEKQQLTLLRKGHKSTLEDIYKSNKAAFSNYALKFSISNDEILDIYQDAIIALFENAIDGKMEDLNCTIKTYLFSIGKNMIYQSFKNKNKSLLLNQDIAQDDFNEAISVFDEELNDYQLKLQKGFRLLGNQCKKILTLFYYNGFTLDEITEKLEYTKKDVLKSQKSRCISKLKSILKVNG
jgi:RNA polymerase sigma factor (sigma-70 family)